MERYQRNNLLLKCIDNVFFSALYFCPLEMDKGKSKCDSKQLSFEYSYFLTFNQLINQWIIDWIFAECLICHRHCTWPCSYQVKSITKANDSLPGLRRTQCNEGEVKLCYVVGASSTQVSGKDIVFNIERGRDFFRWKDKGSRVMLISHKRYIIDNGHIIDTNTPVS